MACMTWAEEKIMEVMDQYGLFDDGWHFDWNNRKTAAGICNYAKKAIYLSKPITAAVNEAEVMDTIAHEIAHALVGGGHGHDHHWARKCRELGGSGTRIGSTDGGVREKHATHAIVSATGRVLKRYLKKPRKSVYERVHSMYVTGQPETKGTLRIVAL